MRRTIYAVVFSLLALSAAATTFRPITISTKLAEAIRIKQATTMSVTLTSYRSAPKTVVTIETPPGVIARPRRVVVNLRARQSRTLRVELYFSSEVAERNQEIFVRALYARPNGIEDVGFKSIAFSRRGDTIVTSWDTSIVPVGRWREDGSTPPTSIHPTPWNPKRDAVNKPDLPRPATRGKGERPKQIASLAPTILFAPPPPPDPPFVTLDGRWFYDDRSNVAQGIDQQIIEIRRGDGSVIGGGLFPCLTNADGSFSCTFEHPGTSMRVWVRSWVNFCNNGPCDDTDRLGTFQGDELGGADSIWWAYPVQTGEINCQVGTTCDVGGWVINAAVTGEPWQGAHQISQDLIRSNKKAWFAPRHPGEPASAGDGRVTYPSTTGTSADTTRADGWIFVQSGDRSADIANHEYGHVVMANWYAGGFPPQDCPSPHFIDAVGGTNCAWYEGFASFWGSFSNEFYDGDNVNTNDGGVFDWFGGGSRNYETRAGFANGDMVEGNVTAAMWDIFDNANDDAAGSGSDTLSAGFEHLHHTTYDNDHNNFSAWWGTYRADGGHSACLSKRALWNNSIQYADPSDCTP